MTRALLVSALLLIASPAAAQTPPAPITTPLKSVDRTSSGQPIVMPPGPVAASVSMTTVPAHGAIPPHKHPWPRYVYVLSGRLKVTNLDTGQTFELKPGDMTVDPLNQWHKAEALGEDPVRLIGVDNAPPGVSNTVRREP